ncbi:acetyl-CoA synthetase-like protein [Stipitochalara longipes BDJ]|nr:acetyl-CoA synthetase-like protein [Stipitochalara longipes BDJ]
MGSLSNDDLELGVPHPQQTEESSHVNQLLPQVLDKIAAEDPDHPIGIIANPGTMPNLTFSSLSSSQMADAVNFTSHWLRDLLDKDPYETISFIGLQDYRYWIMTLAAIKTGHPLLLASPRNAIVNNASLLHAANCDVVFYSGRGSPLEAHVKALQNMISGLKTYEIPNLEQMIAVKPSHYPYNKTYEQAKKDTILFLHTSGSTGNPKPIRINNAFLARMTADELAPVPAGRVLAATTLARKKGVSYMGAPFFHISGVCTMAISLCRMNTNVVGPVDQILSGDVACAIVRNIKLNAINAVPFIHDAIFGVHGEELKDRLIQLDHINSFGGPLPRATGKWCADNLPNTALWQGYGMTENIIPLMLVAPSSHWHCIEFHPTLGPIMEPISPTSDLYEVVFRRHPDPKFAWLHPVFEIYPHLDEWRSGDLFHRCRDEGFEHLWEFEGRIDDIMILGNGAKVNPLHIEARVTGHQALKGCLMFGEGRTACGILLEPTQDGISKDELLSSVWPTIEEANLLVPERARVVKSLIVVANAEKPLARAAKGTLVRKQSLKLYEVEIQEAYNEAGIK